MIGTGLIPPMCTELQESRSRCRRDNLLLISLSLFIVDQIFAKRPEKKFPRHTSERKKDSLPRMYEN